MYFDKYILQFGQICFLIQTNTDFKRNKDTGVTDPGN